MILRFKSLFHHTNRYIPGYGRTHDIYDRLRSLQDLHCSGSEVLEGYVPDLTTADTSDSRCIAGLLNGNMGVVKSMMGELTDSTNIAQVSGLFPVVWSLGITIGYGAPHPQR